MVLQNYKIEVIILDLVFIMLGPFLHIIHNILITII